MNKLVAITLKGIRFPHFHKIHYQNKDLYIGPIQEISSLRCKLAEIDNKLNHSQSQITVSFDQNLNQYYISHTEQSILIFEIDFPSDNNFQKRLKNFIEPFLNINQFLFMTYIHFTNTFVLERKENDQFFFKKCYINNPRRELVFQIQKKYRSMIVKDYQETILHILRRMNENPFIYDLFTHMIHEFFHAVTTQIRQNQVIYGWNFIEHLVTVYWKKNNLNFIIDPKKFNKFKEKFAEAFKTQIFEPFYSHNGIPENEFLQILTNNMKSLTQQKGFKYSKEQKTKIRDIIAEIIQEIPEKSLLWSEYTHKEIVSSLVQDFHNWPSILIQTKSLYRNFKQNMPIHVKWLNGLRNIFFHNTINFPEARTLFKEKFSNANVEIEEIIENIPMILRDFVFMFLKERDPIRKKPSRVKSNSWHIFHMDTDQLKQISFQDFNEMKTKFLGNLHEKVEIGMYWSSILNEIRGKIFKDTHKANIITNSKIYSEFVKIDRDFQLIIDTNKSIPFGDTIISFDLNHDIHKFKIQAKTYLYKERVFDNQFYGKLDLIMITTE